MVKVFIDESPLGALVFGTDKPFAVALDEEAQEEARSAISPAAQLMEAFAV